MQRSIYNKFGPSIFLLMLLIKSFYFFNVQCMDLIDFIFIWLLVAGVDSITFKTLSNKCMHFNTRREKYSILAPVNCARHFYLVQQKPEGKETIESTQCFVFVCNEDRPDSISILKGIFYESFPLFYVDSELFRSSYSSFLISSGHKRNAFSFFHQSFQIFRVNRLDSPQLEMYSYNGKGKHEPTAQGNSICKLFVRIILIVSISKKAIRKYAVRVISEHCFFTLWYIFLIMSLNGKEILWPQIVQHKIDVGFVFISDGQLQKGHNSRNKQPFPVKSHNPVAQNKNDSIEQSLIPKHRESRSKGDMNFFRLRVRLHGKDINQISIIVMFNPIYSQFLQNTVDIDDMKQS